ncbi:MAG: glycerol-3-phosphate 1-O-acyltransferase PlsY [Dongiaceae bacterium]
MTAGFGLAQILVLVGGYLLGSIPFGLILTRFAGFGDIRQIGSGNIGATNVLRTGNKALALATLLLDGGKGAAAVLIARALSPILLPGVDVVTTTLPVADLGVLAGGAAIVGHLFPVWLKFKGGKGVATGLGTLLAINWPIGVAACLTWVIAAVIFRFSSLSALLAFALSPLYAYLFGDWPQILLATLAAILVWLRHHENIRRLLNGTEPRIGRKKES